MEFKKLIRKTGSWPKLVESPGITGGGKALGEDTASVRGRMEIIREMVFAVENATEGMALLDERGVYKYLNQEHCALLGYGNSDELNGKSWLTFYDPEVAGRIQQELEVALVNEGRWHGQLTAKKKDGSQLPVSIRLSVLPNGDMLCLCRDMSQVELAQKQKARLFEIIANPIVEMTADLKIIEINQAWEKLMGFRPEDIVGRLFSDFVHPEDLSKIPEVTRCIGESGYLDQLVCRLLDSKGHEVWLDWSASLTEEGRILAYGRNITTQRMAQASVIESVSAQMEAVNQRSRFFSMASHELRTPVSSISLGLQLLLRHGDKLGAVEYRETLCKLDDQARRLGTVLEKLMRVGKSFTGKVTAQYKPCSLYSLVEVILREVDTTPERLADLQLQTNLDRAQLWNLDEQLIRYILSNLLSNAFKYSQPRTPVTVQVEGYADSVVLTVTDRGVGIAEKDIKHIGEGFYRGDNAKDVPGTGLGMLLVRQCVEAHEGALNIQSVLGQGTTVTVSLAGAWVDPAAH